MLWLQTRYNIEKKLYVSKLRGSSSGAIFASQNSSQLHSFTKELIQKVAIMNQKCVYYRGKLAISGTIARFSLVQRAHLLGARAYVSAQYYLLV